MSKLLKCIAGLAVLVTSAGCEQSLVAFAHKDAGTPLTCGPGTAECGAQCVNLKDDPNHCGSCDRACAATEVCEAGECYPKCNDQIKNGKESDVDCGGGACAPCRDGSTCATANDCASSLCLNSKCVAVFSCTDGLKNGDETDTDCGGGTCAACATGQACMVRTDCISGLCFNNVCVPPSCGDGLKNLSETDVDCGSTCSACADGKACSLGTDCLSLVCTNGACQPAACTDLVKNAAETDADCGGGACPGCDDGKACLSARDCSSRVCVNGLCAPASCRDGLKDLSETDVDCGGSTCSACADGKACSAGTDCVSFVCTSGACQPAACTDLVKNAAETAPDCGGGACPACANGKACLSARDCSSGVCLNGLCAPASCRDGLKNADETALDCGGSCAPCADGEACRVLGDCQSSVCTQLVCQAPTCTDGVKNGRETDLNCGGPACAPCADGLGCAVGGDCVSVMCINAHCQPPSCLDGVKNGRETDVDCGGACPACGPALTCSGASDCWNGDCIANACGRSATVTVGGADNPSFDPTGDGSSLVVLDADGKVTVDRQNSLLYIARYLYVSNSGEGTVSKIDPATFAEIARYCTAPGCNADPSRVSVSLDGNAGVANRANYFYGGATHPERASAAMIAGDLSQCVDRNGNGTIETNRTPGAVPPAFMWRSDTTVSPDECVLWWQPLSKDRFGNYVGGAGTMPRSATFDSTASADGTTLSSNFYVGLYATNELAQLDAKTGTLIRQVAVGGSPYSSVFDRFSKLWIRDHSTNRLIRVDTTNAALPATVVGPPIPCGYAITADSRGYIYSGGGTCVARLDPAAATPSWETLALPGACFARGPSLDANFNLWVPDTCFGGFHVDASRPFGQGMTVLRAIPLAPNAGVGKNYILGTALDGNAVPYFVNTEAGQSGTASGDLQQVSGPLGTVYRINPADYSVTNIRVGRSPYVYSDLSGSQLALSSPTTGRFRKTFTPWCGANATWSTLSWTSTTPPDSAITVKYRAARSLAALEAAPFVNVGTEPPPIVNPTTISLPAGTDPSYFQVQVGLTNRSSSTRPNLSNLTVSYTCR